MSPWFELHAGGWVDDLPPLYPGTPMLMSSVHPRTKKYVGDRLAAAAWVVAYGHDEKPATGPVLAGCRLEGNKLILSYNTSLLKDDTVSAIIGGISLRDHAVGYQSFRMQVLFKPYNKTNQASAMQVLIGTPFPRAYAESNRHVGPKAYDYPPWQYVDISVSVNFWSCTTFCVAFTILSDQFKIFSARLDRHRTQLQLSWKGLSKATLRA